ncbi:hypothetical protein AB4Z21_36010, partial [Paenibacillus sp. MCAF20]
TKSNHYYSYTLAAVSSSPPAGCSNHSPFGSTNVSGIPTGPQLLLPKLRQLLNITLLSLSLTPPQ